MQSAYDSIPYDPVAHPETAPERLATLGRLFGIATQVPGEARVLEIGCASAANLIPLAFYAPRLTAVGIDVSAQQIAAGRALGAALELTNLRLDAMDVTQLLAAEAGEFDYVICHGVYSWVAEPVREHLLRACRRLLAPGGLAYISYNTRPGGNPRAALRALLLQSVDATASAATRLSTAQRVVHDLAAVLEPDVRLGPGGLRDEVLRVRALSPAYLFHEFLEPVNEPVWVADFIASVERHDLQYLCDADLTTSFPSLLGPAAEAWLGGFSTSARREQALDFLLNRGFRRSVVCRADETLSSTLELQLLRSFAVASRLHQVDDAHARGADGRLHSVHEAVVRSALAVLEPRYPELTPYETLRASAAAALGSPVEDDAPLLTSLFALFTAGALHLSPAPWRRPEVSLERPMLNALVRAQLAHGHAHVTSPRHERVSLDADQLRLAHLLDGERTRAALTDALGAEPVRRGLEHFAQLGLLASPGRRHDGW